MRYFFIIPLLLLTTFAVSVPAWAQETESVLIDEATPATSDVYSGSSDELDLGLKEVSDILKLSDQDPRTIAVRIINAALGFLAIITVVMILWGGFQFLLSGGQEDKTERAGATIRNAIIGLIIIISSWAAVQYILEQFVAVTTAG